MNEYTVKISLDLDYSLYSYKHLTSPPLLSPGTVNNYSRAFLSLQSRIAETPATNSNREKHPRTGIINFLLLGRFTKFSRPTGFSLSTSNLPPSPSEFKIRYVDLLRVSFAPASKEDVVIPPVEGAD